MYLRARDLVLHWLRVPAEPHPPAGAPASLRVFRAGKNYLKLRLAGWIVAQVFAVIGIVFWTGLLIEAERAGNTVRAERATQAAQTANPPPPATEPATPPSAPPGKVTPKAKSARRTNRNLTWPELKRSIALFSANLPTWTIPLIWALKIGGILLYLVQIPFTYALRRLDYEMRWYVVTDRSLRIRSGVARVEELTMSFANLQQVAVTQGPVQRLFGLADVRVQSAGGGGGESAGHDHAAALHTAVFHGVDNAVEIRDLILDRLRQFRTTGLGDPDDHAAEQAPASAGENPAVVAARALLDEARALRRAASQG